MGGTKNFFQSKREWSKIKDSILGWYLTPYLSKIAFTQTPVTIVDCFAGKGKFDSGESGSPLIICEKIKEKIGNSNAIINNLCIEKNKFYYDSLIENIQPYSYFSKALHGSFEEHFDTVLEETKHRNAFFYIDPYGIKSLDFNIFHKIKNNNCHTYEMLMNFNTSGFLREACRLLKYDYIDDYQSEVDESYEQNLEYSNTYLDEIAEGTYWRDILSNYNNKEITLIQAEELFSREYLKMLEKKKIFKYTISIPIKVKQNKFLKYRLIFGTNHYDGLELMCNNMNKHLKEMIQIETSGQFSMFGACLCDNEWLDLDKKVSKSIIYILNNIESNYISLENLHYMLIKEHGIEYSISDYNTILSNLEKSNFIRIDRYPSLTRTGKKATSFNTKEYNINISLTNLKTCSKQTFAIYE